MTEKELKKYIRKKLMRGYPAGELESDPEPEFHGPRHYFSDHGDSSPFDLPENIQKGLTGHFSFSLFLCLSASRIFFFSKFFVKASVRSTPV